MSCTEQGLSTPQQKRVPGILDSSIDGKTLGAIEFIVGHLFGIPGHSSIVHNQQGVVCTRDVRTSGQGRDLKIY